MKIKLIKKIVILGLLTPILFATQSCKKDETPVLVDPNANIAKVNLQFNAKVGTEDVQQGKLYTAWNGDQFDIGVFSYYASNIYLVNDEGKEVLLKDLLLVDSRGKVMADADPNTVGNDFTLTMPAGHYKSIKMGIGLPPELDGVGAPSAETYPKEHALSVDRGTVWSWDNTYRFLTFMGNVNNGGAAGTQIAYSYHLRTQAAKRELTLPIDLTLTNGQTTALRVMNQITKVIEGADGNNKVDMFEENTSHSNTSDAESMELANKVMDNLANSFSIQ